MSRPELKRVLFRQIKMIETMRSKNRTKRSGTMGKNSDNIAPRKKLANHQSIVKVILPCINIG